MAWSAEILSCWQLLWKLGSLAGSLNVLECLALGSCFCRSWPWQKLIWHLLDIYSSGLLALEIAEVLNSWCDIVYLQIHFFMLWWSWSAVLYLTFLYWSPWKSIKLNCYLAGILLPWGINQVLQQLRRQIFNLN